MSEGRAGAVRLHWMGMLLLGLLALVLLTFALACAQETKASETKKPWVGKLHGREITQADLDRILQKHLLWRKSKGKEGQQANLSGASLREANLSRADLSGAILSQANLSEADLSGADFFKANLSKADLFKANLSGAYLFTANLSGAYLFTANLSEANLGGANLSEADLGGADLSGANLNGARLEHANLRGAVLASVHLSGANLSGANLSGANLSGAYLFTANLSGAHLYRAKLNGAYLDQTDLSGAILGHANLSKAFFNPKPGTVSDVSFLLGVKGLASLRYLSSSHSLVELRETFKKAGMREQEREMTFALNHIRRLMRQGEGFTGKLESLFHLVCFEWPCQYGMNPGRPLEILGLGLFLFIPLYLLALRSRNRETGIWLVLPPDRILGRGAKNRPYKLTTYRPFRPLPKDSTRFGEKILRRWRVVRLAFYFSLLSAFNLGWRELNVGNWISRLQKHEYTLRATGWVRTVAGLQSLLSVYMLALWVLTYFGRPFD